MLPVIFWILCTKSGPNPKSVFKTQSNIYDGAFLQKYFTAKSRELFSQKISIVDVRLGSKYASKHGPLILNSTFPKLLLPLKQVAGGG